MKILIIDNNIDPAYWGSSDLCRLARKTENATIYVRRAPHGDLPEKPNGFDRVIVSGSKTSCLDDAPWVDTLLSFIQMTLDRKIPFLGVCYGHQMLIRALGGKTYLRKAEKPEFGWSQIEITQTSPLLRDLPRTFHSYSSHYEEVGELPLVFRNLARSKDCLTQACELKGQPAYGIQFHPEKTAEGAKKSLKDLRRKEKFLPLLHPTRSDELYNPKWGEILFRNFLRNEN